MARNRKTSKGQEVNHYNHPEAKSPMRPDVGTQGQFKKKKPPRTYRYDSSLSPALEWDGQNSAREQGEALIAELGQRLARIHEELAADPVNETLQAAAAEAIDLLRRLKALGRPFLNWSGKAERFSFDVPTLPLFIHERHSTKTIIETLVGHKRDKQQTMFDLFGDPQHSIADQVLRAYEYQDNWINRLILGDSIVVMNSLLHYEGLGGQVQMIYMDPPYGVKYGSNFQPFVRKRDVNHGDDEDMTREPEMVQAYRDTWELGLHSYLSYLRDRLLLARELLSPSGSIFVQISDENLHHVRELMDEVFGNENFISVITLKKTTGSTSRLLSSTADYIVWYGRDINKTKYNQIFNLKADLDDTVGRYDQLELIDGTRRPMTTMEKSGETPLPVGARRYQLDNLTSSEYRPDTTVEYRFENKIFFPGKNAHWKTTTDSLDKLAIAHRLQSTGGKSLRFVKFLDDFPATPIGNIWSDIAGSIQSRSDPKIYVVQTSTSALQRCLLMTTGPGDLVLDPTCGSGTTAYVAEQWGRRWIAIDISRVPLALARQRLLTATFPWYELKDEARGPVGGFVYKRKQSSKGEETGGIVPHITLRSIANNEPPAEEILVDRPEVTEGITRVTGLFAVEGTIPVPTDWENDGESNRETNGEINGSFSDRLLEVLRKSPVLRLEGNRTVTFESIRPPAKTLSLSAEATLMRNGEPKLVAFTFGPENGAVSQKLVQEALRESYLKCYDHLYVIGFAIQPDARTLIEQASEISNVPATYIQATPDLLMGDLLKNMRSSQIFSVCGLPEVALHSPKDGAYQVELLGLDVFDPVTMEVNHQSGNDVPAWFLDTDYNGLCFHICQAFFPRTGAWDTLKRALKGEFDESVWDHLAGTMSTPFEAGEHRRIAVKVIDDRGNELLVVKPLSEARR